MKTGDLVRIIPLGAEGLLGSYPAGLGIIIELNPYLSAVMTKVFWMGDGHSSSVPTKSLEVVSEAKTNGR